ncbi:hypothetical protein CI238_11737 [Colletotrichum incanum]|uniref:Uncharacterized protein n=1 Tax=Colletotrichum incanum TaxID=1573173 RepID=A0A161W0P9_COLIC|nr:hypothetical protein CI238_11737 [Colletotrichum incanum]
MGHRHHMDDASSVSSYSSGGSSRSSSRSSSSSGSSKKSRSSQVSHSNIKSDHWAVSLMKYTAGAPFGKPMSLRKTKVREFQEDWGYDDDDDDASVYSNISYTTYAWVKPKWDDSISEIASRSDSRSSGRRRRGPNEHGRPRFTVPPHTHQHPPPFHHPPHPPPPPPFMSPPGAPMYDEDPGFFDMNTEFHPPPPPPPPAGSGGAPAFFDLSGSGGGGNHPGKYDDWE